MNRKDMLSNFTDCLHKVKQKLGKRNHKVTAWNRCHVRTWMCIMREDLHATVRLPLHCREKGACLRSHGLSQSPPHTVSARKTSSKALTSVSLHGGVRTEVAKAGAGLTIASRCNCRQCKTFPKLTASAKRLKETQGLPRRQVHMVI